MNVQRIAAFSRRGSGGNPAGVVLADHLPAPDEMQRIAAEVGYSETAFAAPMADGNWRVRYFAPQMEVPFCGHATIALGAALGAAHGAGRYALMINDGAIAVTAEPSPAGWSCTLESRPTRSTPVDDALLAEALALFGYAAADLDAQIAPRLANAGSQHLVIPLRSRAALSRLSYDLDAGRRFMQAHGLVTVMFIHRTDDQRFDVRNAFASGGVLEDPATGAAAAALAGMLRDMGWPHRGHITLLQGDDMGSPSTLEVMLTDEAGAPVQVRGETRPIA
ncbi:PhzF family phenazine biosynthesis protein [Sandarakinorhabdus oryzae]|uniref:PhzF family phenazine biosynthesis protein n=1 Tax=Sandarakinorhabdus oryzae TaxID=2675220 RepID=UPI0012E2C018|nr:PhzF family phenazine biosynthesis protein [Sandarakinorhabdus oryzae]